MALGTEKISMTWVFIYQMRYMRFNRPQYGRPIPMNGDIKSLLGDTQSQLITKRCERNKKMLYMCVYMCVYMSLGNSIYYKNICSSGGHVEAGVM